MFSLFPFLTTFFLLFSFPQNPFLPLHVVHKSNHFFPLLNDTQQTTIENNTQTNKKREQKTNRNQTHTLTQTVGKHKYLALSY